MTIVCSAEESKKVAFSSRQNKDALEVRFVSVDELSEFDTPASVYFQRSYLKAVSANDTDGLRHIFPVVYSEVCIKFITIGLLDKTHRYFNTNKVLIHCGTKP
jgi:hypothetical protein